MDECFCCDFIMVSSKHLKWLCTLTDSALATLIKLESGGSKSRHSFFEVLEAGKSKVRVPAWLVSNEGSLWLTDGCLLHPSSHGRGAESQLAGILSYKSTCPVLRALLSWPPLTLITSQRSHLWVSWQWRSRLQQKKSRGHDPRVLLPSGFFFIGRNTVELQSARLLG